MNCKQISDSAILVRFADQPSMGASDQAHRFLWRLSRSSLMLEGVQPAYTTVLISFNPLSHQPEVLIQRLKDLWHESKREFLSAGDLVAISVDYDGEDLEEVARETQLSVEEVIRLHCGVEYKVAFLGSWPGFPYLIGLPQRLACAPKERARLRISSGSVVLAGRQCGIYSSEAPGNWRVIGKTSAALFDPHRALPTLLKPGDRVRFEPWASSVTSRLAPRRKTFSTQAPLAKVLDSGMQSSVQDLGRTDYHHLGVSRGGAADRLAMRLGSQILGNSSAAAAVEMTRRGISVQFLRDALIALTGSGCDARLDGRPIEMWGAQSVREGQNLVIGDIAKFRTYLHVRGGLDCESVLGSRSTFVSGKWGGQTLRVGEILYVGSEDRGHAPHRPPLRLVGRLYSEGSRILRVTEGPHWERFSPEMQARFLETEFTAGDEVNRLGLRLEGAEIHSLTPEEIVSEGVAQGAIQIPPSGKPMILFCEQCTTGTYPRIAHIIGADLWRLAQLKPGDRVGFRKVDFQEALQAQREWQETLQRVGFDL